MASGKALLVVGHRENVFHFLPEVLFAETWGDALVLITDVARIVDSPERVQ